MKYKFDIIINGQIGQGYTVIDIVDGLAEVDPNDKAAVELAERYGGVPQAEKKAAKKKEGND